MHMHVQKWMPGHVHVQSGQKKVHVNVERSVHVKVLMMPVTLRRKMTVTVKVPAPVQLKWMVHTCAKGNV